MSEWNGLTEPLEAGDRVRILNANFPSGRHSHLVGELSAVTKVNPPGMEGTTGVTKWDTYELFCLTGGFGFARTSLWKIPPDQDYITDEDRINEKSPKNTSKPAKSQHA